MLLGLLAERWDELDGICQWVQADLDPGYIGETKADYIFVKVILSVAAGLRESKMRALASMEKKIIDSRMPGPVALFEAWDAARNNDQAGFEKGMTTALKQFSAQRGERFVVLEWIALHESIVNLAARRLGLKHPELPPELDAYLMTPETIENN
ncbi:MAG: hypothetical protein CMJ46_04390 [Planctomyces sp.]|nr:hypothetical protein [Planctomyces sp.]